MAITFRQLDAFRAVMLAGTVVGAAKMLGVSQPAISRLISDLEQDIGYNLFEREGRRVSPTGEAKLLFEEVRRALIGLGQIRDAAIEIGRLRYSRLRLVTVPSLASTVVVDLIERFSRDNGETFVSLEVQSSDSALEWVVSEQCDLGIAAAKMESPSIASRTIHVGASVCILPLGHRLAEAEIIRPEMLEGESFVSFRPDALYRREVDTIFLNAGVTRNLIYEARTTDAVCSLVAAGLGVSLVGPLAIARRGDSPEHRNIVARPFTPTPPVTVSLLWSTNHSMSASAKEFLRTVEQHFELQPS
ncbi:LysR substrate-binding domain-containing protein [Marinimicrococcus flavescens]|uniref:LysR substrate-binding domain-containing protein n=1 Tax=Marinimicrococcus flavescens TaxID=3031815 RepID=A0AAP3XR68_9PROT|nr:LysR substrate-binding domain-containing protein [Marinimicrococcus flavescens]